MIDLWPDNIGEVKVKSPVTILREQASLLGQKTKNIVQAEVVDAHRTEAFIYGFLIVGPALGNYRFRLLMIRHDISLYPVLIDVEEKILEEIGAKLRTEPDEDDPEKYWIVADDEEEFVESLKAIFGAQKTKRVIAALLSQSDPNWEPPLF